MKEIRVGGEWGVGIQATECSYLGRFTGKRHDSYTEIFQIRGVRKVRKNRIHLFLSGMSVTFSVLCSVPFYFSTLRHLSS